MKRPLAPPLPAADRRAPTCARATWEPARLRSGLCAPVAVAAWPCAALRAAVPATLAAALAAATWAAALPLPATAAELPRIVTPDAQQVVHSNAGTVRVVVTGAPPNGWLRPVLDERPLPLQRPPAFELQDVDRGTHTLRVQVLDGREQLVALTRPVEFHVWQASRRLP